MIVSTVIITPITTPRITADSGDIYKVLDDAITNLEEYCVLVITSKIVAICEGSTVLYADADKESLVIDESDLYLSASLSKYGHHFTITNNTLIPMAGIDESNGDGRYILWPRDAQKSANDIRRYLNVKFGIKNLGIIITDSTCQPLRRGTTGIALAHSGFKTLRNYIGTNDLFDRPLGVTQANIAGGLAAAAVVAMGEGSEQTPLCVITGVPNLDFTQNDPSEEELAEISIPIEDDLFAPFLTAVDWQAGKRGQENS